MYVCIKPERNQDDFRTIVSSGILLNNIVFGQKDFIWAQNWGFILSAVREEGK